VFSSSGSAHQSQQQDISDYFEPEEPCPYLGWRSYLPDVPYSRAGLINDQLAAIVDYFTRHGGGGKMVDREELFEKKWFPVDMNHMLQVCSKLRVSQFRETKFRDVDMDRNGNAGSFLIIKLARPINK
jgi:hypothetical protein